MVHQPADHIAEHLDQLNDDDDRHNGDDHDVVLPLVLPVVHGEGAKPATSDGASHGGVSD